MSQVLCKDSIYAFSGKHDPVLRIASGTRLTIETYDCFTNQIQSEATAIDSIDWNRINPATGPIFVEGAMPGDVLKVHIERIELADRGVMATGPGLGVMGHRIEKFEVKLIPIEDGHAHFNQIKIPLNPMIGVIGVAPAEGEVSCGTPGAHGGNMDNTMITEGATLYFPVGVEGALFGLGDLHAAMGDGEVGVSGIEIPGKVTVTVEVIKGLAIAHPFLENADSVVSIVSAPTLDEAVKIAVEQMVDRLLPTTGLPLAELTMLMSAVGQTQICQVVDPLMTARFVVPKRILNQLDASLF
ncbi:acetamidase [Brevibacillus fluminis]|uniref:Acetamidase n=1 Tax=Brevibacillus fluminis TaxID=511487 RepID=A0A3M8DP51_9BACL|nr:acetamidase/formamidase family protein [Brevibacillus fluminis]RNB89900.1 acetamidase [Brevibacillus fluminis]